jgi:hypothetical protein
VDLDMDMDAPVVEPKHTLLSKLQSSKNGTASNGEEGTATRYSRVGHDQTTEVTPS